MKSNTLEHSFSLLFIKSCLQPFEKDVSLSITYKIRNIHSIRDNVEIRRYLRVFIGIHCLLCSLLCIYLLVLTQGYFEMNSFDFKCKI